MREQVRNQIVLTCISSNSGFLLEQSAFLSFHHNERLLISLSLLTKNTTGHRKYRRVSANLRALPGKQFKMHALLSVRYCILSSKQIITRKTVITSHHIILLGQHSIKNSCSLSWTEDSWHILPLALRKKSMVSLWMRISLWTEITTDQSRDFHPSGSALVHSKCDCSLEWSNLIFSKCLLTL